MNNLVIFSHGKSSNPWGEKITHLAEIAKREGADVISLDYSKISNPDERVQHLLSQIEVREKKYSKLILVGSSMGAYVSAVAATKLKPQAMFLLAPAIGFKGYMIAQPQFGEAEIEIVMGWQDELIPVDVIVDLAQKQKARLHLLDSDHRLTSVLEEVGGLFQNFLKRNL